MNLRIPYRQHLLRWTSTFWPLDKDADPRSCRRDARMPTWLECHLYLDTLTDRTDVSEQNSSALTAYGGSWSVPPLTPNLGTRSSGPRRCRRPAPYHLRPCPCGWTNGYMLRNTTWLANCIKLSLSWTAHNFTASQEMSRILWKAKVHCRHHKSPPFVFIQATLSRRSPMIHFNTVLLQTPKLWQGVSWGRGGTFVHLYIFNSSTAPFGRLITMSKVGNE